MAFVLSRFRGAVGGLGLAACGLLACTHVVEIRRLPGETPLDSGVDLGRIGGSTTGPADAGSDPAEAEQGTEQGTDAEAHEADAAVSPESDSGQLPTDAGAKPDGPSIPDAAPKLGAYLDPCDNRTCGPNLSCVSYGSGARPFCTPLCDSDAGLLSPSCEGLGDYAYCIGGSCATYCDTRSGSPSCIRPSTKCVGLTSTGAGVCAPR